MSGRSGFALFFGWTVTQLGFERPTLGRGDVMDQLEFRLLGPFEVSSGRRMILLDFTAEQFASVASTRLQEARLSAVEAAAEVELALGRPDRALCYLLDLSDAHPFRERLAELRILALYRSGRQADALAVYETIRLGLADELGVDPGPALRKLHLEVLRQEPSLVATAPLVIADVLPALPVALSSFVGRERELELVLQMLGSHRLVTLTGPGGSGRTLRGARSLPSL